MSYEALAQLAEAYLQDFDIWPLGASSRIRPAVMGFAAFLAGRGVTLQGDAERGVPPQEEPR